jgi:hypothetical protein
MSDLRDLVGKIITFNLHAPSILGSGYTNVKVIGAVTSQIAKTYTDILTQHAQVFSSLPPGTVDSYKGYDYLLIENSNGVIIPIGFPWIQGTPVESESSLTTITFTNLSATQIRDIELILRSNNFNDFSVKIQQL